MLYEFVFDYYNNNLDNPVFAEEIGSLYDSVALFGKKREYAPPYTEEDLEKFFTKEMTRGQGSLTTSVTMSVTRMDDDLQKKYKDLYQIMPGENLNSGRVLDEEELALNKSSREKYEKLMVDVKKFANCYENAVMDTEVSDLIIFASNGSAVRNGTLKRVQKELKKRIDNGDYDIEGQSGIGGQTKRKVEFIDMPFGNIQSENQMIEAATKLASAKYIVAFEPIRLLAMTVFRSETKEIMLPENPFNLYGKALGVNYFLKWREKYGKLAGTNHVSILQIPSKQEEERYRRNYSHMAITDCSLLGSCGTDIFFQDNRNKIRNELEALFPEAKNKKVILYMPTLRKSKDYIGSANLLDLESLREYVGDDYVVVLNYNKDQFDKNYTNIFDVPGFSKTIIGAMTIRELMIASDVIVGDYRDSFFESALLEKPVFSTAYDYEEMMKARNINVFDFSDYIFCPVVSSALELSNELDKIDSYDYSIMREFREKMFSACDGHSTERVVDLLLMD